MKKRLTFVDASVLITATVSKDKQKQLAALKLLGDKRRAFAATEILRLEVIPIPLFHKHADQVEFYDRFFDRVQVWVEPAQFLPTAYALACRYGLGTVDALHVAAAAAVGAEFVSTEKPTKPLYQAYLNAVTLA